MIFAGHSVPFACLGGFVLFFGFFAFNGGSALSIAAADQGRIVGVAVRNTVLGGLSAGLSVLPLNYIFYDRKLSIVTCINAILTGMVSMCAACDAIEDWSAVVMGLLAGPIFMAWSALLFKMGIDDPVDAVGVHLGGGLWGVLTAPIFHKSKGILYNWDQLAFQLFFWNLIGTIVIIAWTLVICGALFFALKFTGLLRVSEDHEKEGLDEKTVGDIAYPENQRKQ